MSDALIAISTALKMIRKGVLDQESWFHVLKELRSGGVLYLILMGGEAMLSPHFWPILREGFFHGFSCFNDHQWFENQDSKNR